MVKVLFGAPCLFLIAVVEVPFGAPLFVGRLPFLFTSAVLRPRLPLAPGRFFLLSAGSCLLVLLGVAPRRRSCVRPPVFVGVVSCFSPLKILVFRR